MITEDYVSFETAKLLKEKGFDEKCRALYTFWFDEVEGPKEDRAENWNIEPKYFSAPTLQMAMKWLHETHKIFIFLEPCGMEDGSIGAVYKIITDLNEPFIYSKNCYYKQEEAYEDAIKYCLENLI